MKNSLNKLAAVLLITLMILSTFIMMLSAESFAAENLPDGTYTPDAFSFDGGTGRIVFKCDSVVVKDGKATAIFNVTKPDGSSTSVTHLYLGTYSGDGENTSLYDPSTDQCGADVYKVNDKQVTIPVTLNKDVPFAGRTMAMSTPHWIQYSYKITIAIDDPSGGDDQGQDGGQSSDEDTKPDDGGSQDGGSSDDKTPDGGSSDDKTPDGGSSDDKTPDGGSSDDNATYETFSITNNANMFKAVKAQLKTSSGKKSLLVALSANGYENLYKGTYDAALANGLNKTNWIHGYKNADDKWEFEIPLSDNETRIPIVSISKSHLEKVEAGTETIEKCMFYRLIEIDYAAKAITTGDYYEINDMTIENSITGLNVDKAASFKTIGAASSNSYSNLLTLKMGSADFDIIKANTYSNYGGTMKVGDPKEIILGSDSTFAEVPIIDGEQTVELHSKAEDKWYTVTLTVDLANKKASFTGSVGKDEQKTDGKEDAEDNSKEIAKVKKTAVKGFKVKAAKKKMTVSWKANKKVFGGYQISYKLGKKTKTVNVKKGKTAKKVIKKLKSKKKYTVKIRGFKKIGGQTIYGKWSKAKKIKIK